MAKIKRANGTGSISKLPGNRRKQWRARITKGWDSDTGKQIFYDIGYFSSKKEAEKALNEYLIDPYEIDSNDITFEEVYNKWSEEHFKQISASAIRTYKSAYMHSEPLWKIKMKEIRTKHLETTIKNAKVGSNTKSRMKSLYNLLYRYAIKYEIVYQNYANYCDNIKPDEPNKIKVPFTSEEINLLWENINVPFADIILIAIYSGWRPKELISLKKDDINLVEDYMRGGSKTLAGKNRIVPIHPIIKPLIEKRYNEAIELLFTNNNMPNGKAMSYTQYYNRFKEITKALGMRIHTPHETRHTFITLAKEAEMDEYCLKLIIGHSITDLTERVYTHRKLEQLHKEIQKIK